MSKTLETIGAIASVIGALFLLLMFWMWVQKAGMVILPLQLFGVIGSILGIICGGIALLKSRPERTTGGEIGFGLGLGNILALIIAMMVFG